MTEAEQRASRQEIFERLISLLDSEARLSIDEAVAYYESGQISQALDAVARFDETIGGEQGMFAYVQKRVKHYDKADRPIYRPFLYVFHSLEKSEPKHFTRYIVNSSCAHIEGILKHRVRPNFIERISRTFRRQPMGSFLRKREVKEKIPAALHDDLLWLNDGIYRFGKHEYADWNEGAEDEARLFDLDEAIAIYFIARCLGWRLLQNEMVTALE